MDVKSELKVARDAIKQKDYKVALKHCKNVMKMNKENYTALIFIGKCCTETGQYEQAKQAYLKAIAVNNEQLLAWQGFHSLLERVENPEWNSDLVDVYKRLMKESEGEKYLEIRSKLVSLLKKESRHDEALSVLLEDIEQRQIEVSEAFLLYNDIISLLKEMISKQTENASLINKLNVIFVDAVEKLESDANHHQQLASDHLQFLITHSKVKDSNLPTLSVVFELATNYHRKYPENVSLRTLFCKILLHHIIGNENILPSLPDMLKDISDVDATESFECDVVRALLAMSCASYQSAITFLQQAVQKKNGCTPLYYLLAVCHGCLHQNDKAQNYSTKCLAVTEKLEFLESRHRLIEALDLLHGEIMLDEDFNETKGNAMNEIIGKYTGTGVSENIDWLMLDARVQLKVENIGKAAEIVEKIKSISGESPNVKLLQLKAELSLQEEKFYDAEIRIQEALEVKKTYRSHFLLGKVYWRMAEENPEYFPKAYGEFLKAAKLDTMYAPTFYYLGRYQKEFIKDTSKALKCLEKAHSLDHGHSGASGLLADTYLQLDEEDKAVDIYVKVTSGAKVGERSWAWLRLGLIYSKQNIHDKAIVCFQNALRGDISISHHWECLAEAYFDKGSYTSALKAFSKAVELDPTSCYAKFKIAKIKQMLQMDTEAVEDYKNVLQANDEYVPALLGIAETYLHLEQEKLKVVFDGRAVEYAQNVVYYISRAVEKEPTFSILWKTVADALVALHVVCEDKCTITIPEVLQKILSLDANSAQSKTGIIDMATRCYMVAIKLKEDIPSYWHDLAIATYYCGLYSKGDEGREKIKQSLQIVKKALSLDPCNPKYWNTLGVLSGSSGPSEKCCGHSIDDFHDAALSQHAFIKALQLNSQDGQVWCNLGMLYLKHNKIKAAHEAFKKAQASDPTLTQAWIGQALIAETIANDEAMDLFRHSTELRFHGEGSLAYAQWVCNLLHHNKADSVLISTTPKPDMSHLPLYVRRIVSNASVALQKSTERFKDNTFAFNTLGLLLEHEGLYSQAEKAFSCARKLLSTHPPDNLQNENLRKSLLNQARVLCELGKHKNAIEIYKVCDLRVASEVCLLALTYYRCGLLEDSVQEYEKALSMCTTDSERSDVLSALGMVQFARQNNDAAKSFLFESTQQQNCSEHGIMALVALGLLHGDGKLAMAALVELAKHRQKNTKLFERKKTMLMSAFYKLQSQTKAAKREWLKATRKYPNESYFWCQLSKFTMQHEAANYHLSVHCSKVASTQEPSQISSLCDAMSSLVFPADDSGTVDFRKSAQKLVHNHPEDAVSWVLLAAALNAEASLKRSGDKYVVQLTQLALSKVDETLRTLRNSLQKLPISNSMEIFYSNLYSWTMQLYVLSNIYYGDIAVAQSFCDKVLPTLKGDNKVFEEFVFLKGLASIQENMINGGEPALENIRVMATLALKGVADWKLQVLANVYSELSMPVAATLCLKQRIANGKQNNEPYRTAILRCCLFYIKTQEVSSSADKVWLEKSQEVLSQAVVESSLQEADHVVILLKAVMFHQQGNKKAALKYLQKLVFVEGLVGELVERFQEQWK